MSVQVYVNGFDGRPVPTGSHLTGYVRVKCKKPEQARAITQVLFAFYGRSSVHITRRKLVTRMEYSSHDRFERHYRPLQPRQVGPRSHWETSYYTSDCLLFSHRQVLVQSNSQIPVAGDDCAVDFPFEVRVPTHSEPQPPDNLEGHNCECFSASGCFPGSLGYDPPGKTTQPQPLPDSIYSFEDRLIENTEGTAQVRYTMHAIAPELSGGGRWIFGSSSPAENSVDISLYNPVSMPPTPIQYKTLGHQDTVRTMRLLQDNQNKRLSLRDNMRSIFKKDKLPWLALGLVFQAPELLWIDQPAETKLPFSIGVRRLAGGVGEATGPPPQPMPGVPCDEKGRPLDPAAAAAADDFMRNNPIHVPTPKVYLKSLKLKLVAHTALRGGYDRFSGFGPKRFEGITPITFFKYKTSSPTFELPVGDNAWLDLGQALDATLGPLRQAGGESGLGGITGEFLTPNVWRRYGVEWDLRLDVEGEEVRWESETNFGGGLGMRFLRGDGAPPVQMNGPPSMQMDVPTSPPAYSLASKDP
ncbi:hypothetical protein CC79DRAFT_1368887 [Sarocladium strictum]